MCFSQGTCVTGELPKKHSRLRSEAERLDHSSSLACYTLSYVTFACYGLSLT